MNDLFCWELKYQTCAYSESLLNKIYLQNKKSNQQVDILEIKKAIYYAKKYHGSQKRLSGKPYYSHPLAVAELVAPHCFKTDILVTSILHDTIEDTDLTKDMLEYIFDVNIANKVDDLTRIKIDRKISSADMLELLWLQKKEDLLLVKFFDRLHNMQTIETKPIEKIRAISEETLLSFLTLNIHLENIFPDMLKSEKELTILINKYLSKRQLFPKDYRLSYHLEGFHLSVPYFENDKY